LRRRTAATPVIVRSSAVGEGLEDRGLYRSICLDAGAALDQLAAIIEEIFKDFCGEGSAQCDRNLPAAPCAGPSLLGMSPNERHLSPTRHQWKYMIELPAVGTESGLNSKFAQAPDEQLPLALSSLNDIGPALRRICHWVNLRVDGLSHLEWCAASGRIWIVQLDQESPTSRGVNPHVMPDGRGATRSGAGSVSGGVFTLYRFEDDVRWRKLRNLRDFWTGAEQPRHGCSSPRAIPSVRRWHGKAGGQTLLPRSMI
jgi:hypothetical protein